MSAQKNQQVADIVADKEVLPRRSRRNLCPVDYAKLNTGHESDDEIICNQEAAKNAMLLNDSISSDVPSDGTGTIDAAMSLQFESVCISPSKSPAKTPLPESPSPSKSPAKSSFTRISCRFIGPLKRKIEPASGHFTWVKLCREPHLVSQASG